MKNMRLLTYLALVLVLIVTSINTYADEIPKQEIPKHEIINGFDFNNSDSSYFNKRLSSFVDDEVSKIKKGDLIIGHSMGGLISMGVLNSAVAKGIIPAGVITVDSPVTGFAGLDEGYDRMKANVISTVSTHARALSASVSALPTSLVGSLFTIYLPDLIAVTGLGVVGLILDLTDKTALLSTIMAADSSSNKALLIKDMGKASDYVKSNVQETKIWHTWDIVNHINVPYIEMRFKKVWGVRIPYFVVVLKSVPVYWFVEHTKVLVNHYTKGVPIGHVVGTDNDPLRMAGGNEPLLRNIITGFGVGYGIVAGVNTGFAFATFPFGTAYFAYHAAMATNGAVWCGTYKDRWGDIIGGRQNDGFITVASQRTYWNTNMDPAGHLYFAQMKIDHQRSTPSSSSTDALNKELWGKDGLVDRIAKKMKAPYDSIRK